MKTLVFDVKTGQNYEEERPNIIMPNPPMPDSLDISDFKKIKAKAVSLGWL